MFLCPLYPYGLLFPPHPQTLAVGQHPAFVIIALSTARIFHTFPSNTTAVPAEIITKILNILLLTLGRYRLAAVLQRIAHNHPIASISRTLRSIHLDLPYSPSTNSKATAVVTLGIRELSSSATQTLWQPISKPVLVEILQPSVTVQPCAPLGSLGGL